MLCCCRRAAVLPQTPFVMLAVDDAGGVCRRHALQRPAGRTHPCSSQEHPATHGRHSRVVRI